MEDRLIVTASPHIRDASTTRGLMGNVVIALLPAVLAAGLIFGVQALVLVAVTTLACVAFEYIYEKLLKKPNTVGDLSAVVTGIILALNMPVGMPLWIRCRRVRRHRHHEAAVRRPWLQLRQPRAGGPYRAVPRLHLPHDCLRLPRHGR